MKTFTLPLTGNAVGSDPIVNLYAAIAKAYPTLGYTQANSKIDLLIGFPAKYKPQRTLLRLVKKDNPTQVEEFYYDRNDITLYVKRNTLTMAEAFAVRKATGVQVLNALSAKIKQNLTARDFWVEDYQWESVGGTSFPNFRLKARADSPYWFGQVIVQMADRAA